MDKASSPSSPLFADQLFNQVFGQISSITDASEIAFDKEGNVKKVAIDTLKGEPVNRETKIRNQDRNLQILSGVSSYLKGQKPHLDKSMRGVAKQIYKKISKELKGDNESIRNDKDIIRQRLDTLTSTLREDHMKTFVGQMKAKQEEVPTAAIPTLTACQRVMEEMKTDTGHIGMDIKRYLDSEHIDMINHNGRNILDFQPLSPPEDLSREAKDEFRLAQKFDRVLQHFLIDCASKIFC